MRDQRKHFPVNWIDGMKINKNHFIDQDNAWTDALHDLTSLPLSPQRYGILPPSAAGEKTFSISASADSLDTVRVVVHFCQAVTPGGVRISLPDASNAGNDKNKGLEGTFTVSPSREESISWIFLFVHPYDKQPAGSLDLAENPPRYPYLLPTYSMKVVSESEFRQYANHPYGIPIGRIVINGNKVKLDEYYIPPCCSIESHPDLAELHGKVSVFLVNMESWCTKIIQDFYRKEKPTEIFHLIMFLTDRMMLCLAQVITSMKWNNRYEPPARMFADISVLARVMINTIDLRIGSGKDTMVNFLVKVSKVKSEPGQFENMLKDLANDDFSNNQIDSSRQKLLTFMGITGPLFEALSTKDFPEELGKTKTFVKENDDDRPRVYDKNR
jgi:hypothetical protein